MPNTDIERQKVRLAIKLITDKYMNYLFGNNNLRVLMTAPNDKFDEIINFQDPGKFMIDYHLVTHSATRVCQLLGYTHRQISPQGESFKIFINRQGSSDSTLIHELLHAFTHVSFSANVPDSLAEAITEYFTRKVQGRVDDLEALEHFVHYDADFKGQRTSYDNEFQSINATRGFIKDIINPNLQDLPALNAVGTKNMFKRAYFSGELAMVNLIKDQSNLR